MTALEQQQQETILQLHARLAELQEHYNATEQECDKALEDAGVPAHGTTLDSVKDKGEGFLSKRIRILAARTAKGA